MSDYVATNQDNPDYYDIRQVFEFTSFGEVAEALNGDYWHKIREILCIPILQRIKVLEERLEGYN